ncbi:MAG: hypothetical protein ACRD8A_20385, partial [Candidatus Acidiferrales bacterium]
VQAAVEQFSRLAGDTEDTVRTAQSNAQKSLDVTLNSLRLDQRAWLGIADKTLTIKYSII